MFEARPQGREDKKICVEAEFKEDVKILQYMALVYIPRTLHSNTQLF
jgi:hypothetical protein